MRLGYCVMLGLALIGGLSPHVASADENELDWVRVQGFRDSRISNCAASGGIPVTTSSGAYSGCAFLPSFGSGTNGLNLDFGPFISNEGHGPDGGRQGDCNDASSGDGAKSAKQGLVGNPVVVSTGSKVESEVDFETASEMGLFLSRTYNSGSDAIGLFGRHWASNFDYKLTFGGYQVNGCYPRPGGGTCAIGAATTIWAHRPNGVIVKFVKNAADGIFYEDKPSPVARIVIEADGRFRHYAEDKSRELYSSSGYIQEIKSFYNVAWNFTYSGTYPTRVTHTSGRYIEFFWTGNRLTSVRDPAGSYYGYSYLVDRFGAGQHLLSAMSFPGTPASTRAYHYEDARFPGALTGKSESGARYSWFAYDALGRATLSRHSGSIDRNEFTYTANAEGKPQTVTMNPLGRRTTFTYDNGRVVSASGTATTYCAGSYRETTYDANGYPNIVSDFEGHLTDYDYAPTGHLLRVVEAAGTPLARTTEYVWNITRNELDAIVRPGQYRIDYTYGSDLRVSAQTVTNLSSNGVYGQTRTTSYSYAYYGNAQGGQPVPLGTLMRATIDGPLPGSDDLTVVEYDTYGNLTSTRNGLGHTTTYSNYNALGQVGRIVGPNGDTVDYVYDPRGRVVTERRWHGATAADTVYAYNAQGLVVSVTSPDAVVTHYEYDAARRPVRVWRQANGTLGDATKEDQLYTYDAMSNVTRVETRKWVNQTTWVCVGYEGGVCIDFEEQTVEQPTVVRSAHIDYDELGRVRARRGNNGQVVRYTYDDNGNVKTIVDSQNRTSTLTYDALGRTTQSQDATGGLITFEYDTGDRIVKVTDPRNLHTTYVYDGFGQLWAQHSPDTGSTSFQYSAAGLRTLATRNDGSTLSFNYDTRGRLTWYGTSTQWRSFGYDWCQNGKGRLCEASYSSGTRQFSYTPYGQLQGTLDWTPASSDWTGYSYDTSGRLSGIAYPSGVGVGYGYAGGKLTAMTATLPNGTTQTVASGVKHLPFAGIEHWTYGNGIERLMAADMDGRPTAIHSAGMQGLYYTWNASDEIVKIVNGADATLTQDYGYDALSRLTSAATSGGTTAFAYDGVGNRTQRTYAGVATNYAYGATSHQLLSANKPGLSRSFTTNGIGNIASWHGADGVLNSFAYDAYTRPASHTRNGVTTTYTFDALDQRVKKTLSSGASTRYVYAGQNRMLAEHSSASGQWTSYLWLGGTPVGLVKGNTLYWVHPDHLGRPEMVTNSAKQRVWRAANLAFERNVLLDQIGGYNLGFPGQYWDAESGVWQNGFRDYEATAGRYMQSDPIGLWGGINTYSYALGNPVRLIDPLGQQATGCDQAAREDKDATQEFNECMEENWAENTVTGAVGSGIGAGAVSGGAAALPAAILGAVGGSTGTFVYCGLKAIL